MITKIFIGGFSLSTDELALAHLVGPYGNIVTMKIVRDKVFGKSKGYAFIEMSTREEAELVIDALDGKMIGDLELKVSIRDEEPVQRNTPPAYKKVVRNGGAPVKTKRPRLPR